MPLLLSYVSIIFLASISMILGLFLFTDGFFLYKDAMVEKSICLDTSSMSNVHDSESIALSCAKQQIRIVLLIVDALKFEFVETFEDATSSLTFHKNKLPIIHSKIKDKPKNSRLFKFIADPPTTTMQRLKSLTTGTLPTFIDVHNNFAADKIVEDNFVNQNEKNGNIFLGDNTWTRLYPDKFIREYAIPSFDVSDLDSVDSEVKKHIFSEIKQNDWTLLIAHILGIDHCGHKHGMHHKEMTRKLNETNYFIKELIEAIENEKSNDSILFVIGDHGMTESGDHGGDSVDEVEAAMFVYSTVPLQSVANLGIEQKIAVNQVDIVPTISIILGLPIPFSNIGNIIIEALPSKMDNFYSMSNNLHFIVDSVWKTAFQVYRYIDKYSTEHFVSSASKLNELKKIYLDLKTEYELVKSKGTLGNFIRSSEIFFSSVHKVFYEMWVQFDFDLMFRGLILFFCSILCFSIVISKLIVTQMNPLSEHSFFSFLRIGAAATLILCGLIYLSNFGKPEKHFLYFSGGLILILCLGSFLFQNHHVVNVSFKYALNNVNTMSTLSIFVIFAIVLATFSNSYIVQEDSVLSYLLITLFATSAYSSRAKYTTFYNDKHLNRSYGKMDMKKIFWKYYVELVTIMICAVVRITKWFWRYREEQKPNNPEEINDISFVIGKQGSIRFEYLDYTFIVFTVASLITYFTLVKMWLRNCKSFSGYSGVGVIAQFLPVFMVFMISFFWVWPKMNLTSSQFSNAVPLIIYGMSVGATVLIFSSPLIIFSLPKVKSISEYNSKSSLIRKCYNKMSYIFFEKIDDEAERNIPVERNLQTVYSSLFVLFNAFLGITYVILLGYIIAPSVILMNVLCIGFLYVSAIDRIRNTVNKSVGGLMCVSNKEVLSWFLIAEYFFYATGHQQTFTTIHWDAGFVGVDGALQLNFVRAILIGFNTFGSYIIMGLMLPLLNIIPFTLSVTDSEFIRPSTSEPQLLLQGEILLYKNHKSFHIELFSVAGRYILLHAFRVFACMLVATVHCRHLMVWKIFAPKLIFEGISLMITIGSVLVSLFLLLRIENQLGKVFSVLDTDKKS